MSIEIDIHNLSDHKNNGGRTTLTRDCQGCRFAGSIVNRDWAPGHPPVGLVCLWGKQWMWLENPVGNLRACTKLSRPTPTKTISERKFDEKFIPFGVSWDNFTQSVFTQIVSLYTNIIGGNNHQKSIEYHYRSAVQTLGVMNAYDLRLGSSVSDNSKFTIDWRYLSGKPDQALFFSCYPQAHRRDPEGYYLTSRFELAVNKFLKLQGIAVPLIK